MNPSSKSWLSRGLALWIALGVSATLFANLTPLGLNAGRSVQSWWTSRRFQQADADLDLIGMQRLGAEYLHQSGDGTPLHFAIYQIGFAASGPSMNRLPDDALDWALLGSKLAQNSLAELPSPWDALQTQSHILVERAFPINNDPELLKRGLQSMSVWLASGGGPQPLSRLTSKAYQDYLRTAPADRPAFLLRRLSRESSTESPEQVH